MIAILSISKTKQAFGLIAWIALCIAAGAIGAIATADAQSFYRELARPSWAPPAALFGPVWTVLYILMGASAWLVWRERRFAGARIGLGLFLAQLAANALWSWLFFGARMGGIAFVEIALLLLLILATLASFSRIRPLAGVLLVPYLAWVTFAGVLNYAIWQANPRLLG